MIKIPYFSVVFVTAIILSSSSADKCEQQGPCMCKFDDYTQINLTQLLSDTKFIQDRQGNYTYFFSGCRNKEFKAQDYKLNSNQTFSASLVKCVEKWETHSETVNNNVTTIITSVVHNCSAIGEEKQIKYVSPSVNASNVYQIAYLKEGSPPTIQLVCDNFISTDLKIANYESDILTLYSPLVCIKHISHHELSTGSIFCILFFTAAIIYFVGGGLIMYTARGARGVEIIPNFDFWASLPGLMRDGMVFILSGCRPFTVATAETYDRI